MRTTTREWIYVFGQLMVILLFMVMFLELAKADERMQIAREIKRVARMNGIDPELAVAIAEVESSLDPNAVGSLGEIGVFQLRPEFHPVVEDEKKNISTAVKYLAQIQRQCSRYGDAFFICFNLGHAKQIKYPRRFPYYLKVMKAKREIAGGKL